MSCGCLDGVLYARLTEPMEVRRERLAEPMAVTCNRIANPFTVEWFRFCKTMIDLVAFSASDGMFLTSEGYTILVKI